MPSPRDQAEKAQGAKLSTPTAVAPCCGAPKAACRCSSRKNTGAEPIPDATAKNGSKHYLPFTGLHE